jgi:hypothetical protein
MLSIYGAVCSHVAHAQSAPAKPAAADAAAKSADSAGFSIESEMLTYRALESNSEAVACDVAAYLNGGSANFTNPPAGTVCTVNAGANPKASVVIFPFDQSELDDFRNWRAAMETMKELRTRAATHCPENAPIQVTDRGAISQILGSTPAGTGLSIAQGLLGMMATEASVSTVGGTIQDQAFINSVSRELRAMRVAVLMPGTYNPYSLAATDTSKSPFLSSLVKVFSARECLEAQTAKNDASVTKLVSDMDTFLASLTLSSAQIAKASPPAPAKPAEGGTPAPNPGGTPAAPAPSVSPSRLTAVLSADSLAQKLGVDPATGLSSATAPWQHVLLVKAMESGGSIAKNANIFGTKIRYTGGSVGTYALFTLDGELECSGNVYAYGGSVSSKRFEHDLRNYKPDPKSQFIFQRGSCSVPVQH